MKKINIIFLLFACLLVMVSCEDSNENLVGSRGENIVPTFLNLTPKAPSFIDVENDSVTFSLVLLEGDKVDDAAIKVTYDGKSAILRNLSLSQDTLDVKIFGSELLTALGITKDDVALGTSFLINVTTTLNGVTTCSPASFWIKLPCKFNANLSNGSYHEVSADWQVEGDVKFVADENDPYTIYIQGLQSVEGLTGNGNSVEIHINPASFAVTGGATVLAEDLSEWGYDYTNYTFELLSGNYSSCEGTYVLIFDIYADQGGWGSYAFTFTKN
jgi:hypothetical protein